MTDVMNKLMRVIDYGYNNDVTAVSSHRSWLAFVKRRNRAARQGMLDMRVIVFHHRRTAISSSSPLSWHHHQNHHLGRCHCSDLHAQGDEGWLVEPTVRQHRCSIINLNYTQNSNNAIDILWPKLIWNNSIFNWTLGAHPSTLLCKFTSNISVAKSVKTQSPICPMKGFVLDVYHECIWNFWYCKLLTFAWSYNGKRC